MLLVEFKDYKKIMGLSKKLRIFTLFTMEKSFGFFTQGLESKRDVVAYCKSPKDKSFNYNLCVYHKYKADFGTSLFFIAFANISESEIRKIKKSADFFGVKVKEV